LILAIQDTEEAVEKEYIRFENQALKKFLSSEKKTDADATAGEAGAVQAVKPTNAGFGNVFQAVEQSKLKNDLEKEFKVINNKLNVLQTMNEKIWRKVNVSNGELSIKRLEELKSSIDYLTHFLITKDIDILSKEDQVKKLTK